MGSSKTRSGTLADSSLTNSLTTHLGPSGVQGAAAEDMSRDHTSPLQSASDVAVHVVFYHTYIVTCVLIESTHSCCFINQ